MRAVLQGGAPPSPRVPLGQTRQHPPALPTSASASISKLSYSTSIVGSARPLLLHSRTWGRCGQGCGQEQVGKQTLRHVHVPASAQSTHQRQDGKSPAHAPQQRAQLLGEGEVAMAGVQHTVGELALLSPEKVHRGLGQVLERAAAGGGGS